MSLRIGWIVSFALAGCNVASSWRELGDAPSHSSTIASVPGTGRLITVDEEENAVVVIDPESRRAWSTVVEGEPSRVATLGERIWVTLRHSGQVVEFAATNRGVEEVARTYVGSEPVGIVAHPDGTRLYVAVSLDHQVLELDIDSREVLRRFEMPREVRWLAVHPGGTLYAVGPTGPTLFTVDLIGEGAVVTHNLASLGGASRRATGDPDLSPDGTTVAVPTVELDDPNPRIAAIDGYYAVPGDVAVVGPALQFATLDRSSGAPETSFSLVRLPRSSFAASVAWLGNERVVAPLPGADQAVIMDQDGTSEILEVGNGPWSVAVRPGQDAWIHERFDNTVAWLYDSLRPVSLGPSALSERLRDGRDLFYSTTDQKMTSGGISCASCHVEGRSDNHTWALETGPWQTPSLAGNVDDTAPVSWAQGVGSVAEEAELTAEGPMGGNGLADYPALAEYINHIRLPNPPSVGQDPALVERGRVAFEKAQCHSCHTPPNYTDNRSWVLYAEGYVQTPTLRGVAATAPYLHDGRAETLESVLRWADGWMGSPEFLSEDERTALVAFLKSL